MRDRKKYLEYQRQYYTNHSADVKSVSELEYHRCYIRQWRLKHPESAKQYNRTHLGEKSEWLRNWRMNNPEKVKEHCSKRRDFGFVALNKYFKGSEAHHLNKTYIVYLPQKLHRSIFHCLQTNENMREINEIAMKFISEGGYDFMTFKYGDIVAIDKPEGTYKAKVNWSEDNEVGLTYLSPENARGGCSVLKEEELRLISSSAKDELAERIASIPDDELERAIQSIRGRRLPKPVTARKKTYPGTQRAEPKVSFDDLFKQMEDNPIK